MGLFDSMQPLGGSSREIASIQGMLSAFADRRILQQRQAQEDALRREQLAQQQAQHAAQIAQQKAEMTARATHEDAVLKQQQRLADDKAKAERQIVGENAADEVIKDAYGGEPDRARARAAARGLLAPAVPYSPGVFPGAAAPPAAPPAEAPPPAAMAPESTKPWVPTGPESLSPPPFLTGSISQIEPDPVTPPPPEQTPLAPPSASSTIPLPPPAQLAQPPHGDVLSLVIPGRERAITVDIEEGKRNAQTRREALAKQFEATVSPALGDSKFAKQAIRETVGAMRLETWDYKEDPFALAQGRLKFLEHREASKINARAAGHRLSPGTEATSKRGDLGVLRADINDWQKDSGYTTTAEKLRTLKETNALLKSGNALNQTAARYGLGKKIAGTGVFTAEEQKIIIGAVAGKYGEWESTVQKFVDGTMGGKDMVVFLDAIKGQTGHAQNVMDGLSERFKVSFMSDGSGYENMQKNVANQYNRLFGEFGTKVDVSGDGVTLGLPGKNARKPIDIKALAREIVGGGR